jgi:sensor domain CHASE-containing protein
MERLQGAEWHNNKKFFKMKNWAVSDNGHYRVVVIDKRNNKVYSHWLNPKEQEKFEKVKHNYKCMK